MIEQQKSKHNWEFIFLGANMDAVEVANSFGIARNRSQSFHNDSAGIALNWHVLGETVKQYRFAAVGASLDDNWSADIQADYKKRKGKK
jgi:hypothetical protein